MKATIFFLLLLVFTSTYGQTDTYQTMLNSAKVLFKSNQQFDQAQLDSFDYTKVVSLWEEVVRLDPNNPEELLKPAITGY